MPDNVEGSVNLSIVVDTGGADKALTTTGNLSDKTKEKMDKVKESEKEYNENSVELLSNIAETNDTLEITKEKLGDVPPLSAEAEEAMERVRRKSEEVTVDQIKMLTAMNAAFSGINSVIGGFDKLIPMSDDAKRSFQQFQAVVQMTTGTISIIKALSKTMKVLDLDMKKTAVSGVAAAAASNPLLGLAAAAGIGVAVGATTAYFLTQNVNTTNVTQVGEEPQLQEFVSSRNTGGWT